MNVLKKTLTAVLAGTFLFTLSACAPEIGSDKWCAQLKAKPTGDWTANEAVDYAKHCILK
jgi:hypothetical protein